MTIEERMLTLEWELRKTKWRLLMVVIGAALVMVVCILVLAAVTALPPGTVKASRFLLVDDAGRIRAALGMWDRQQNGMITGPALTMVDEEGNMQAQLLAEFGNAHLELKGMPTGPGLRAVSDISEASFSLFGTQNNLPHLGVSVYGDEPRIFTTRDGWNYRWVVQ